MKSLPVTSLQLGTVAPHACYGNDGELLISKGVTISDVHLDALKRHNISEVYIKENEDELEKILSKELTQLDELDLDADALDEDELPPLPELPDPVLPEELHDIKEGKEGLGQLLNSAAATAVEAEIEKGAGSDKPEGPPLSEQMTQIECADRTDEYKSSVVTSYDKALQDVSGILKALAKNENIDGGHVRSVVSRFFKTFLQDKNIILNISNNKPLCGDFIFHHSLNVCLLSLNIAAAAGYSETQVIEIGMAALLHDVGMLLVPRAIRTKTGRLSPDDWFEIQKHPILGLHLLEKISRLPRSVPIVAYQIHERENAKGYPRQRNGRLVHRYAKIVQCADVFEACASPRPHRPAMVPYTAMEILVKMVRGGFLSSDIIRAYLLYSSMFPIGSLVELSDHRIARVVSSNGTSFTKPQVSVIIDKEGAPLAGDAIYQLDLKKEPDVQIVKSLRYDHVPGIDQMSGF